MSWQSARMLADGVQRWRVLLTADSGRKTPHSVCSHVAVASKEQPTDLRLSA
jgi:hypothetical protein